MAENKGITLELDLNADASVTVTGDSFRLKQVLLNLLSNAIKYTDEGGVAVKATLTIGKTSNRLDVSVIDTGVGIPKNRQVQLFTPYYQAGGQKQGTGLGLYLCRQLIQKEGGDIELTSEAGAGTRIRFHIDYQSFTD